MSSHVKSIDQLKDSRLLYDKKVPELGFIIIMVLIVLMGIVTVWSIKTPKAYIIKSIGTVQSINKNYVMTPYTGKIAGIKIEEGMYVEKGDVLLTIKSADFDLQAKQLEGKEELFVKRITQLKKLADSIKDNKNYFDESEEKDNLYYSQFKSYESQIAQQKVDTGALKAYGYTDAQIESEIEKNKSKITEIYYSALKGIGDSILQYQDELSTIKIQLEAIGEGREEYQIKANATGKIHMLEDYKEGMVVQAGGTVASIASEQGKYNVQALVSADSIALVSVGDKVDIAVSGLAQTIYGTISGTVTRVDTDITVDNERKTSYFKVDIKPDNTYLVNKDGNRVNLSNGMPIEARIHYDQVTYFNYVLESLGILSR